MKLFRYILAAAAGLLAGAAPTQSVPSTMNYQGRLTDNTPQQAPLNATVNMQFEIWDTASGGSVNPDRLWVEPASGAVPVPVTGGVFSTRLGGNGVPLPAALFSGGAQRWLQLIVNGETLAPRQALSAAGYANQAENANTAASAADSLQLDGVAPAGWQRALAAVACPSGESFTVILPDGTAQCAPPAVTPPLLLSYSDPGAILTVTNGGAGHAIDASASGGHVLYANQSGGGTAGYFTGSAASTSVIYVLSNGSAGITVSNQSVASSQPGISAGTSGTGPGVKGTSAGGPGVEGVSTGGNPGVHASSASAGPALKVDGSSSGAGIAVAQTGAGAGLSVTQSGGGAAASFTSSNISSGTLTAVSSNGGAAGSFQNQSATNILPALSGTTSGTGAGVSGTAVGGAGLSGTSTSGPGVLGVSTSGNAGKFQITAAASAANALLGTTNGAGAGVLGSNTAASGVTYGVYGDVSSANGYGLYTPDKTYAGGGYKQPGVGGEVLRILRGLVNSVGGVTSGSGFVVSKLGTGRYSVTYATAFSSDPATTVTTASIVIYYARVSNVTPSSVEIDTYDQNNVPADVAFHFIAIGVP